MPRFIFFVAIFAVSFLFAAVAAGSTPAQSAGLSPRMAVGVLTPSLVHVVRNGRDICTAFKVAPATYLTARHCTTKDVSRDLLRVGSRYRFVEQYITPDDPKDDWAVIKTGYNNPRLLALGVGCNEEVYLGMPVAYAGYPEPLGLTMVMGHIILIEPTPKIPSRNSEYVMDNTTNKGASGSPVISLRTGNVIGILIQLIGTRSFPRYATGIKSIKSTLLCRKVATTASDYQ